MQFSPIQPSDPSSNINSMRRFAARLENSSVCRMMARISMSFNPNIMTKNLGVNGLKHLPIFRNFDQTQTIQNTPTGAARPPIAETTGSNKATTAGSETKESVGDAGKPGKSDPAAPTVSEKLLQLGNKAIVEYTKLNDTLALYEGAKEKKEFDLNHLSKEIASNFKAEINARKNSVLDLKKAIESFNSKDIGSNLRNQMNEIDSLLTRSEQAMKHLNGIINSASKQGGSGGGFPIISNF